MDDQERQRLQAELDAAVGEALDRYGAAHLWWLRRLPGYEPGAARSVARSLLREGPASVRRLVERIEDLSDALDPVPAPRAVHDRVPS